MQKISVITVILILLYFSGYSQDVKNQQNPEQTSQEKQSYTSPPSGRKYSKQNLQQASNADLNLYLKKAKRKKTTGMVLTLTGTALFVIGAATVTEMNVVAAGLIAVGVLIPLVGIPLWATGSNRKRKVNNEFEKRARLSFDVAPNLIFANKGENPSPGATLRIRF